MRCTRHGLATSPDGTCVLCRRELAPTNAPSLRWLAWLVAGTIAVLLAFSLVRLGVRSLQAARATPEPKRDPAFTTRPAWSAAPPAPTLLAPRPGNTTAFQASTSVAVDDRARIEDERKRVSITVYTTSWCPHCKEAKSWLKSHDLAYFERDIEQDPSANTEMRKLNPRGGVPTIHVDDEVIVGFSDRGLDRAIDNAARRRIASQP
jgi:glutaredoxin-like YruB-family protein